MRIEATNFLDVYRQLDAAFIAAPYVHTEKWQGKNISKSPEMRSYEILNFSLCVPLMGIEDLQHWQDEVQPNLPWADDHFAERVCGEPLNPGEQWNLWPWGKSADRFRGDHGQFNHSYMERFWPKFAGRTDKGELGGTVYDKRYTSEGNRHPPHSGIRCEYGDLNDLVELLSSEPLTRQAWIPLFFPEDTGIADGGRKPCTLGYQFILRDSRLHVYYPLRSCDYIRHFKDDIYMAIRLLLWVLDECRKRNPEAWSHVLPGTYNMHCTSFHIFANDHVGLRQGAASFKARF